jgi:hypothetical protein
MKTLKQLIKEYWLPFVIACIWTAINIYKKEWNALSFVNVDFVNIFGASFILLSWFSDQYFRIVEQTKVEDNLEKIEKRANDIFDNLELKTALIFSQITGGKSFCSANLSQSYLDESNLTIMHQGDFPLYDLTVSVVDLDKFNEFKHNPDYEHEYRKLFSIGTMLPKQINNLCKVPVTDKEISKSFNIFFSARNGMFSELLRLKKINNEWVSAMKIFDGEKTLLESVSDGYPKSTNGEVDW